MTDFLGVHARVERAPTLQSADGCGLQFLRGYAAWMVGLDVAAGIGATALASYLRFGFHPNPLELVISFLGPVAWVLACRSAAVYDRRFLASGAEEYRAVMSALVRMVAVGAVVAIALKLDISRVFAVVFTASVAVGALGNRYVARTYTARGRAQGRFLSSTLVVGRADSVRELMSSIRMAPAQGMRVVAACVSGLEPDADTQLHGVPIFGAPEDTLAAVEEYGVEVVAVAADPDLAGVTLRRLSWALGERQVELMVAPGITEVATPRLALRPLAGTSLLHVESPCIEGPRLLLKRAMDTVMAAIVIFTALPILATVALLIKLDDGGPVLYLQERVGLDGRPFKMFKFRSMVVDADARVQQMGKSGQVNKVMFKQKNDPRVTRIGHFLRRYSIDELPQLLNVLRGEMSLVGPRPALPREVAQYEPDDNQRLRVLPGITGLWQVSGRSDLDWGQTIRLDLWYCDNWSPTLDLQILVRTLRAVVGASGAY